MNVKILIDNITKGTLISEWGLAVWIEYNDKKILLDTGATGKFVKNAQSMGIDLDEADCGVLSHAHYDHSDGLAAFFECNKEAKFYLRKGAGENCYGRKWIFSKYIGIHRGYLEKYKDRIIYVNGDYELFPGVVLLPHKTPGLEEIGKKAGMYVKKGLRMQPDNFGHEQSLVFDTPKGLVLFNSCSHGGAANIIREATDVWPDKKIYGFIGGFHLYASSDADVRALAEQIKETGIQKIYTGHCTGKKAFGILKEILGERVELIYTGKEMIF